MRLRRIAELVVAPLFGVTLLAFVAIGDRSEENGYSETLSLPDGGATTAVCLAAGIVLVAIAVVAARRSDTWSPVIHASMLGVATGFSLRVLSAKTVGANIGAGMVMLAWPLLAIALLWLAGRATRRRGLTEGS